MLDQTTVKLGKTEYVLQQLPATRGLEVGIHLVKIVMGAAEGIGDVREGQEFLDSEYNPAKMAAGLMGRVDETGTPAFIKTLIRESLIKPDPTDEFETWYENHFAANYEELTDLLTAIIGHNGYMNLIKKKMGDIMGIFSSEGGEVPASTRSSKARS